MSRLTTSIWVQDDSALIYVETWETAQLSMRSVSFTCAAAANASMITATAPGPGNWSGRTCAVARVSDAEQLAAHTAGLQAAGWQRTSLLLAANVSLLPAFDASHPIDIRSQLVWRPAPGNAAGITSVNWCQLVSVMQLQPGASFTAADLELANMATTPLQSLPSGLLQWNQWAIAFPMTDNTL